MTAERWLPIAGYEGMYEVSDHGRVRSLDRLIRYGTSQRFRAGRVMSQMRKLSKSEHRRVGLSRDHATRDFYVHRLVLEAFVGPCPAGMEACHNDGDPTNNHLSNLRWDTRAGNVQDALRHGTNHQRKKTHCPRGHLLQMPNLRPEAYEAGRRQCRACHYATAARNTARRHGRPVRDMQVDSDARYRRIMADQPEMLTDDAPPPLVLPAGWTLEELEQAVTAHEFVEIVWAEFPEYRKDFSA